MKKLTILSTAILLASSANAAEVYQSKDLTLSVGGRAEARADVYNSEAKKAGKTDQTVNDQSRARLNFDAKTQINDSVFAHGFTEGEYTKDGGFETRYLYVGIGNENIEAQYGKTDGSLGQVTDIVDFFDTYSGQAQAKLKTADRTENQLLVIGHAGTFTLKANANGGGQDYSSSNASTDTFKAVVNYGLGASAVGDLGAGFTLGGGIAYEDLKDTSLNGSSAKDSGGDNALEAAAGLGYTYQDLYLSVGVNQTNATIQDSDLQTLGYAVAGAYNITDKLTYRLGYASQSHDNDGAVNPDDDSFVSTELSYVFTPNFKLYTGLEYGLSGTKDDSIAGRVGANMTF
ncbi:porin [Vibrio sp. 10N.261.51.F12]|uniref:porin n=1 Tax=Vibrio sp. 10N.261.51.F12 TaxID=3229679 RepID=UPI00354F64AC